MRASLREVFDRKTLFPKSQKQILTSKTEMVTLNVSVTDAQGHYVAELARPDFEVYENGIKQELAFFSDADIPLNLGILLDTSGSLEKYFEKSLTAVREVIQTSHPDDQFFFVTFAKYLQLRSEFADGENILRQLTLPKPVGATAFYDSVYFGLEKVKQGRHRKHALLIISDGQENSSRYSYNEMMNLVKSSEVQIYCIGIGNTNSDDNYFAGDLLLIDLAKVSGGKVYFPNKAAEFVEAATEIALLLRHQYSVGYYPTDQKNDGKWRKLKIKLRSSAKTRRLRTNTRQGYYPAP